MTQELIKLEGEILQSGLQPSLDPETCTLWQEGENVIFRKAGIEKFSGYTEAVDLTFDVFTLAQARVSNNDRAYVGGSKRVGFWEQGLGLSLIETLPMGGGNIRLLPHGTFLIYSNGIDRLRIWANEEIVIPTTPFGWAKTLFRSNVHVLVANSSQGENYVHWCAANNIEDWTPTRANSAGGNILRDLDGPIICHADLGRSFALYSEERMTIGQWIGQPNIFGFQPAINGIGAAGPDSVVAVGARNIGLGRAGVFETDGSGYAYVDEPVMQKYIQDNVDFSLPNRIKAYNDKLLEQVVFYFRNNEGTITGIPYYYNKRIFGGFSTLQVTAVAERLVFDNPLGVIDGKLVFFSTARNAGSTVFPCRIRTKPLDCGERDINKYVDFVRLVGQWSGGKMRLGAITDGNHPEDVEWFYTGNMQSITNLEGRDLTYLTMEFFTDALDAHFNLSQIIVQGEAGGFNT